MDKPYFIISLDTELLWGSEDVDTIKSLKNKNIEIRNAISCLLNTLDIYKIPVTWAIVGHLFLENCKRDTCLTNKNIEKYDYEYKGCNDPYSNLKDSPLFYGKDIIEEILSKNIKHEIGYHSFSHPVFTEICKEMANDEINKAKKIEKEFSIKFESFIFPRNEIAHKEILIKHGFKIYRGKTKNNYLTNKLRMKMGSLIPSSLSGIPYSVEPKWMDGIWEIQSSMFFCDSLIPPSLLPRTKLGIMKAIKHKKIFHIWFHPWNLVYYKRLKDNLEKLLKFVSKKRERNELEVITMGQLAEKMHYKEI